MSIELDFEDAVRHKQKLKLGIVGPSGSGKTFSALQIASGMGGKIALCDTENGSAALYADKFQFKTVNMSPPYLTQKYIKVIDLAVEKKFDILIIDSISHQWAGEGGLLARKTQLDSQGGNSYANWGKMTPEQEAFLAKILHCPIHLILTMRAKQDYALVQNKYGKLEPQKMGMAPVQRDGIEYELTTVFDVNMDHKGKASKDRTGLFVGQEFDIDASVGQKLKSWLDKE